MVSSPADSDTSPQPFFHEDSGAVRFWVLNDASQFVGASVSKEA